VLIYYHMGKVDTSKFLQLKIENSEGLGFTKNIKAKPGFNKVVWNREFDAIPYTEAELVEINAAFDNVLQTTTSQRLRRAYESFQSAGDTAVVQRRIISQLIGFLNVDPSLGISKAEEGEYKITLQFEGQEQFQSLIIRSDPLLKEE